MAKAFGSWCCEPNPRRWHVNTFRFSKVVSWMGQTGGSCLRHRRQHQLSVNLGRPCHLVQLVFWLKALRLPQSRAQRITRP